MRAFCCCTACTVVIDAENIDQSWSTDASRGRECRHWTRSPRKSSGSARHSRVGAQREKLTGQLGELAATERVLARYSKGTPAKKTASAKTPTTTTKAVFSGFGYSPLLVGLIPDGGVDLAISQGITTVHSGSVERQGQPAGAVDGNDPDPPAKAPRGKRRNRLLTQSCWRPLLKATDRLLRLCCREIAYLRRRLEVASRT